MRARILFLFPVVAALILAGCGSPRISGPSGSVGSGKYYDRDGPPDGYDTSRIDFRDAVPRAEMPLSGPNKPYVVMGKSYRPVLGDRATVQTGYGSWYGKQFHGKKTSTGEIYDMYKMTAAHTTMELPSYARVTNLENGKSVIVRVNDRGPFLHNRVIDLSYAAATKLGYAAKGTARVKVERLTRRDILAGNWGAQSAPEAPVQLAAAPVPPKVTTVYSDGSDTAIRVPGTTLEGFEKLAKDEIEEVLNPTLPKVSGSLNYLVQLGAFRSEDNALGLKQRFLSEMGSRLGARVEVLKQQGLYKVVVRGAMLEKQAREAVAVIRDLMGINALVIKDI